MPPQKRLITPEITHHSLAQLGQRFGIHYRVEGTPLQHQPVALGHVHDVGLPKGMHLTLSDLQVERGYTSTSFQSVPWFFSVILEGRIQLQMDQQHLQLGAGEGVCAHFDAQHPLTVHQPPQPRLRTVNIAVRTTEPLGLPAPGNQPALHRWTLPGALHPLLCTMSEQPPARWRQPLVWQGLALQLIGLGLPESPPAPPEHRGLSARDRHRLAALHARITQHPAEPYSLAALAKEAAMSPSSLRSKFQRCYGCSIFDYLRRCRLTQAQAYLRKGYSVQHTAHACGYRHATNFATAFKRAFGIAPHEVHNDQRRRGVER